MMLKCNYYIPHHVQFNIWIWYIKRNVCTFLQWSDVTYGLRSTNCSCDETLISENSLLMTRVTLNFLTAFTSLSGTGTLLLTDKNLTISALRKCWTIDYRFGQKMRNIGLHIWWLVESQLTGCFCHLLQNVWEVGDPTNDILFVCECSLSSKHTNTWWGPSSFNWYNQMHLNIVLVLLRPHARATQWNFCYLIFMAFCSVRPPLGSCVFLTYLSVADSGG